MQPVAEASVDVVSTLAVLDYEPKSRRMRLLATQPEATVETVVENTGFELLLAERVVQSPPPSGEELRILREEVDADRLYI